MQKQQTRTKVSSPWLWGISWPPHLSISILIRCEIIGILVSRRSSAHSTLSTTERPWGDGVAEVISSERKQLRLQKARDFDSNTTLKSTRRTLTGVKSVLARARDDLPSLNYLVEGSYTASFEFTLLGWNEKISVRTEHGSIRWEVQVTFQRPRLFAGPLLQLRHEILVIQKGPFFDPFMESIVAKMENSFFIWEVTPFIIHLGGSILIKAVLPSLALCTPSFSVGCVLVQTVAHLPRNGLRSELSQRRVFLSTDYHSIEPEDYVWIPISQPSQSELAFATFQLPTCGQMRETHNKQLSPSCYRAPFRVQHHLEVSPENPAELGGAKVLIFLPFVDYPSC